MNMATIQNGGIARRNRHWRDLSAAGRVAIISRRASTREDSQASCLETVREASSKEEETLLQACKLGDIRKVKRMRKENSEIDINVTNVLCQTPLLLALKNDDLELLKYLLPLSNRHNIEEALFQAISERKELEACTILKHLAQKGCCTKRESRKIYRKVARQPSSHHILREGGNSEKELRLESRFAAENPLVLASHRDLYDVVGMLLDQGDRIYHPHALTCPCQECRSFIATDEFVYARRRLSTYRGLSSESYLSLASQDPIYDAFMLAEELKEVANEEKHFKAEYHQLQDQLSDYVVSLLDRVVANDELEAVLHRWKTSGYRKLARVKLAASLEQKKFVAHPSCQMKLISQWYSNMKFIQSFDDFSRSLVLLILLVFYPVIVLVYMVIPRSKCLRFIHSPCLKFWSQYFYYIIFLVDMIIATATCQPSSVVQLPVPLGTNISAYLTAAGGSAFHVRHTDIRKVYTIILIYTLGFLLCECKKLYRGGLPRYVKSPFNLIEFTIIALYVTHFALFWVTSQKAQDAMQYFSDPSSFTNLLNNDHTALSHYYWINPDRFYWDHGDPALIGEGLFAIANVFSFARILYIFPGSELLGPLQISLGLIIKDIFRFMMIFLVIFTAFVTGLTHLYWYYDPAIRQSLEIVQHGNTAAEQYFGQLLNTLRTTLWALFGDVQFKAVTLAPFSLDNSEYFGYLIYGAYMVATVIVLLNMLIAMMSLSFDKIQGQSDIEWKFSRCKLYLDYIDNADVLPIPFNLLPTTDTILNFCRSLCGGNSCCANQIKTVEEGTVDVGSPVTTWGGDPLPRDTDTFSYKMIITRVVDRFVSDRCSKRDESRASEAEIKKEIFKLRREFTNAFLERSELIESVKNQINTSKEELSALFRSELGSTRQHMKDELETEMSRFTETYRIGVDDVKMCVTQCGKDVTKCFHQVDKCKKNLGKLRSSAHVMNSLQEEKFANILEKLEIVNYMLDNQMEAILNAKEASRSDASAILKVESASSRRVGYIKTFDATDMKPGRGTREDESPLRKSAVMIDCSQISPRVTEISPNKKRRSIQLRVTDHT